jgi:hypothetical protein
MMSDDVIARFLIRYKEMISGPRPHFDDVDGVHTRIRVGTVQYTLMTRLHGFSLTTSGGEHADYSYTNETVTFQLGRGEDTLIGSWNFSDPQHYEFSVKIGGVEHRRESDHNTFILAINDVVVSNALQGPSCVELISLGPWLMLSDDFAFELGRRIAGHLPSGYFRAMSLARLTNMIGCREACFCASLAFASGVLELLFLGAALACVGWGASA